MDIDITTFLPNPTSEQKKAMETLLACNQQHLFQAWTSGERDLKAKEAFFEQVMALDQQYPGGLRQYHHNAKLLLKASKEGRNPYEGYLPKVPEGRTLDPNCPSYREMENLGLDHVGKLGFVLVAGGLGERLGYSGIKIALPLETVTGTSFIQHYVETILAFQDHARKQRGQGNLILPLAIMTSGDTHDLTVALLEQHDHFGMAEGQITVMRQEKVPSLINNQAHFAQPDENPYAIETKPHGHGDVHVLLHSTGTARRWKDDLGIEHIVFFQDTNGIVFNAVLPALGVSVEEGFEMNSITVPRRAGEAAGGIVRLEKDDGEALTINVEYNQLDPLLKATVNPKGDVPDETGYSPFPGNINVLLFELNSYIKNLEGSGGMIPEFVNPKYADDSKENFKKPTRLECMMQDYPRLLSPGAKVGFTTFPREWCFSAVKNNIEDAAKKSQAGLPPECGASGEMDYYAVNRHKLRLVGANIAEAHATEFSGVNVVPGPKVVISPKFALTLDELETRVKHLEMNATSTLVLGPSAPSISGLNLKGRLLLLSSHKNPPPTVENDGDHLIPISTKAPEELAIRGFQIDVRGEEVFH